MSHPLFGTALNGARVAAVLPFFTGEVGMRTKADGQIEIAYFGTQPGKSAIPCDGTLAGETVRVVEKVEGANRQSVVLIVEAV